MYYPKHKRNVILCVIALFAFLLTVIVVGYFSNESSDIKQRKFDIMRIGVLDGERLKAEALCFKSHEKIADMVSDLLAKIRTASTEMKKSYEDAKKNTKLSQAKRNAKLAKIESKWAVDSAKYNSEMQEIRNLDVKLTEFIQKKLMQTINNLAKSVKLDIVINKGSHDMINVFYNSKNIDITDIVIKNLNEVIPTVNLKELAK